MAADDPREHSPAAQAGATAGLIASRLTRVRNIWRDRPGAVVLFAAVWFALVGGALVRVVEIDRLPGLNGDEAGGAALVRRVVEGDPMNWLTPTRREVSRLFVAIVAVVEQLTPRDQPASFFLVRFPAVVAGLLSIVFAWVLLRRFDREAALSVALLVAALPLLIVISRFGTEVGLVPLPGLLAIAFALRQSLIPSLIALAIALNIHPVGVFFVPVAAFTLLFAALGDSRHTTFRRGVRVALCIAGFLGLALVFASTGLSKSFEEHLACARTNELPRWGQDALRQLTGTHALTNWVGPFTPSMRAFNDYVLGGALIVFFCVGFFLFAVRRRMVELGLTVGVCVTLLFFFLAGGLQRINPDHIHHAFVLGMPIAVAIGLMIREIFRSTRWPLLATSVSAGVALVFLGAFSVQFFGGLAGTGGRGAPFHRTAAVEPKQAAYTMILREHVARGPTRPAKLAIITEDWFTQWAIKYLASGFNGAEIPRLEELGWGAGVPPLLAKGAYAVGYSGGKVEQIMTRVVPPDRLVTHVVSDTGGLPLLKVWWVR